MTQNGAGSQAARLPAVLAGSANRSAVLWASRLRLAKLFIRGVSMSSLVPKLTLALCLLGGRMPAPTQPSTQQNTGQQDQPAPAPAAGAAAKPQQAAQEAKTPKKRRKRVITNDDLDGKGAGLYAQIAGIDLSRVNDCDRYCFEQVRQASQIPPGPNTQWKRDLLTGIDKVKADTTWQM